MKPYKAIIRTIKVSSILPTENNTVIVEPYILAENKDGVKSFVYDKYPQLFPSGKVYEKKTKDNAQFFYVLIYEVSNYEISLIEEGNWKCDNCDQVHENKYIVKPYRNTRLLGSDLIFCNIDCYNHFISNKFSNVELAENLNYVKHDSPVYIYKVTNKQTGKCYVGKTKNAPFFRWWDHLTKSLSPFGVELRKGKLSDWTFEVLEELPYTTLDSDVLRIESEYIVKFDSINNGYNSVISNSNVSKEKSMQLFGEQQNQ